MASSFKLFLIMVMLIVVSATTCHAEDERPWAISLFIGQVTGLDLMDSVKFNADFEDAFVLAGTLGKKFYRYSDCIDLEWEIQVGKYFNDQDNWEFNGLGIARWITFPWDHYIDTSVAAGAGLSYASSTPEIESKHHDKTSCLLAYLMFEADFSLAETPEWSLVLRIHHRSGGYGLFNRVDGASNAWVAGLRYHF